MTAGTHVFSGGVMNITCVPIGSTLSSAAYAFLQMVRRSSAGTEPLFSQFGRSEFGFLLCRSSNGEGSFPLMGVLRYMEITSW